MIRLGLTGSIGMGKSTTAQMFLEAGIPVHDSDAAVHELYRGAAAPLIEAAFAGTVFDGIVDRAALSKQVIGDSAALTRLEAIIHPLVADHEQRFVDAHAASGAPLIVLDIPLLFEVGGTDRVDQILVVTAPPDTQRERVLARQGMTEEKYLGLLTRQMPDLEKRRRADFIIDTSLGMDCARAKVDNLITALTGRALLKDLPVAPETA